MREISALESEVVSGGMDVIEIKRQKDDGGTTGVYMAAYGGASGTPAGGSGGGGAARPTASVPVPTLEDKVCKDLANKAGAECQQVPLCPSSKIPEIKTRVENECHDSFRKYNSSK